MATQLNSNSPPAPAQDVPASPLLPDTVVELQCAVKRLQSAAKAYSNRKTARSKAKKSAELLANDAASLANAVIAACEQRSGTALHVLTLSYLVVFNETVNGSATLIQTQLAMGSFKSFMSRWSAAGPIRTWALGIKEIGVMLKIENGAAEIVLDPARCLELSNAKPELVVYDGFKIVLEGMANMTDGAPWPWKAIPQTILQFAKLVERSQDLPDKIHDLIREISQLIATLFNIRKQEASPHQSELTGFVEVFFADMQRIIIRLRIVEKMHPAKAFLLTDRVNAILEDESARMQEALLRLQTRFMVYTAYTVESILKCVTRIQSTVDTARTEFKYGQTSGRSNVFNGRDESVNAIVKLICASLCACIAIMGSGGIGKTSLSLAVIYDERVVGVMGDSRYFVSVEGASDVGAAAQLLAGQLGLPESSDPLSAAITHLETIPRALLIKDTERMLQRLAGIPTLTLIITSRGAVPPSGIRWSNAPSAGLEAISLPAARETFEQIAGRLKLASERNALDSLLANVDCMPLAVTLLAQLAQLKNPPSKLLRQWQQKKTSFICSDGDDRESSVDVSIQISLNLLKGMRNGPKGQQLLSICEELLVKFALVSIGPEDELKMLSPVRHFVLKHHPMAITHAPALRKIYFDIAASCPTYVGEDFSRLAQNVAPEYGNLTSFLLHLINIEEPSQELFDAITAVSEYAYWTVPSSTLREAFRQRLDAHPVWLALCLKDVARIQLRQDEYALAVVNLHAARKLYATLGDKFQEAVCVLLLGQCLSMQDSLEAAERELLAAKDTFIELGHEVNAARCAKDLGAICMLRDDYARAAIHFTSARDVFKRNWDRLSVAQCTERLGSIQLLLGNFAGADAELQSALAEFEALADLSGTAQCAVNLANLRVRQNDYDSAGKYLATARELYTRTGERNGLAFYHENLGQLRHAQGRLQDATENVSIAEKIYTATGQQRLATKCREMIAKLRDS
ncbi:hypothetical protein BKA62DRAFT_773207 [Auriculariales sp. MPI-PUGE-AT-0066]|nr:hypothetical protein BKA62DRAFT_773207 [Auriculariales sp. MPI-PUGE-AT-0066]